MCAGSAWVPGGHGAAWDLLAVGEALEEADGDRVSVFTVGADDPDADAERGGEADGAAVWVADRDLLADGDALAVAVRVAVASAEAAAAVCEPDEDGVAVKHVVFVPTQRPPTHARSRWHCQSTEHAPHGGSASRHVRDERSSHGGEKVSATQHHCVPSSPQPQIVEPGAQADHWGVPKQGNPVTQPSHVASDAGAA